METRFVEFPLIKELTFIISDEVGIIKLSQEVLEFKAQRQKEEVNWVNVKNIIDTFVLLANSDKLLSIMS
jgi:hypothetical protein